MPELFMFWAALGLAGLVVEAIAIGRKRKGDTLSEATRWLLVTRWPKIRWFTFAGWLTFAGWFAYHIWFDY